MLKSIVPLLLLALCASAACSSSPPDAPLGTNAASIVGGMADSADPAVVLFEVTGDDGGDCTAEFISQTVLVTAAHCALDEQAKPLSGVKYRIYMGDDYNQIKDSDWVYIDPANVHPNPAYTGTKNDITVLVMSTPQNVTPLAFNTAPLPDSDVGASVRLVGYGSNVSGTAASGDNGGFGLKRQLTTTVDDISTDFVHIGKTGANGCDGDSGGPALLTVNGVETIIALDSYSAESVDCTGGDYYQRIDAEAAFIAQYMTADTADAGSANGGGSGTDSGGGSGSGSGIGGGSGSGSGSGTGSGDGTSTTTSKSGCALAPSAPLTGGASRGGPLGGADASWAGLLGLGVVVALRRKKRV